MTTLDSEDRKDLLAALTRRFDREELDSIAFSLGIGDGEIAAGSLNEFCRKLIGYCERREGHLGLGCLLNEAISQRPNEPIFKDLFAKVLPCVPSAFVQVLFSNKIASSQRILREEENRLIEDVLILRDSYPQQIVIGNERYLRRAAPTTVHAKKVLIVDDEKDWQKRIERLIQGIGYQAVKASTPDEAKIIIEADSEGFALITIDLVFDESKGETEGLNLFRELRKRGVQSPCVLISAHLTKEIVTAVYRDTGYSVKTITKSSLISADNRETIVNILRDAIDGA